jgi:hypothetical protein
LARQSEYGYVQHTFAAVAGEPQALSEDEQVAVTRAARLNPLHAQLEEAERAGAYYESQARAADRRARKLRSRLAEAQRSA